MRTLRIQEPPSEQKSSRQNSFDQQITPIPKSKNSQMSGLVLFQLPNTRTTSAPISRRWRSLRFGEIESGRRWRWVRSGYSKFSDRFMIQEEIYRLRHAIRYQIRKATKDLRLRTIQKFQPDLMKVKKLFLNPLKKLILALYFRRKVQKPARKFKSANPF